MNLDWKALVHGSNRVDIPVALLEYPPEVFVRWKAAQKSWQRSQYEDYSVWGPYASLGTSGRFRFPRDGQASYKFPEIHTALCLEQEGFTCWSGVYLFRYGKNLGGGFGKRNTEAVSHLWDRTGWLWPADIQKTIKAPSHWPAGKTYRPRNPDIVAYHQGRNEWRFCEVKGWTDRVDPDQLTALGVLHLLTRAPVSIVRLVPTGRRPKSSKWLGTQPATMEYKRGADLSWMRLPRGRS